MQTSAPDSLISELSISPIRRFKLDTMVPWYSAGAVASRDMTGSSTTPFAFGTAKRTAAAVAMRKAMSDESTSCDWPSVITTRTPYNIRSFICIRQRPRCEHRQSRRGAAPLDSRENALDSTRQATNVPACCDLSVFHAPWHPSLPFRNSQCIQGECWYQ